MVSPAKYSEESRNIDPSILRGLVQSVAPFFRYSTVLAWRTMANTSDEINDPAVATNTPDSYTCTPPCEKYSA
jgi:hypothetical protein